MGVGAGVRPGLDEAAGEGDAPPFTGVGTLDPPPQPTTVNAVADIAAPPSLRKARRDSGAARPVSVELTWLDILSPRRFTGGQAAEEVPMTIPMNDQDITSALDDLPGWERQENAIHKRFQFADHIEAMGFVVRVGLAAEKLDHHPDLRIVYNRVEIELSSHDAGGVTERDFRLARQVEQYR